MEWAAAGHAAAGEAAGYGWPGVRDVACLGEIIPERLVETFPGWRVFSQAGIWWAIRGGVHKWDGPESLLLRAISAGDLVTLAEKLCLQDYLDGLGPAELAAVYQDRTLATAASSACHEGGGR